MKFVAMVPYTLVLALGLTAGCKTANSGVESNKELQAIAQMSEADFIVACNQRLNDPVQGPMARVMLEQYTSTDDCKVAYPRVQALAAEDAKTPDPQPNP